MRNSQTVLTAICAALLCAAMGSSARADQGNRKTVVNFTGPVEIPGQVLPAGTYVFSLVTLPGTRNVVTIQNEDQTFTYATLQTINTWRSKVPDHTHFLFDERPSDRPPALATWYYPGDTRGLDFIYSYSADGYDVPAAESGDSSH